MNGARVVKAVTSLLPPAIGVAVACVVTWLLLSRGVALGSWLLAALLAAHGAIHLLFLVPPPASAASAGGPAAGSAAAPAGGPPAWSPGGPPGGPAWPFDMARSWLVTRAGLGVGLVRGAGIALVGIVCAASLLAALSTVGFLVPAGLWRPLVAGSAIGSLLVLAMFLSPMLLLGVAVDVALLWVAVVPAWSPAVAIGG